MRCVVLGRLFFPSINHTSKTKKQFKYSSCQKQTAILRHNSVNYNPPQHFAASNNHPACYKHTSDLLFELYLHTNQACISALTHPSDPPLLDSTKSPKEQPQNNTTTTLHLTANNNHLVCPKALLVLARDARSTSPTLPSQSVHCMLYYTPQTIPSCIPARPIPLFVQPAVSTFAGHLCINSGAPCLPPC